MSHHVAELQHAEGLSVNDGIWGPFTAKSAASGLVNFYPGQRRDAFPASQLQRQCWLARTSACCGAVA
jgi:hypothetical protein